MDKEILNPNNWSVKRVKPEDLNKMIKPEDMDGEPLTISTVEYDSDNKKFVITIDDNG